MIVYNKRGAEFTIIDYHMQSIIYLPPNSYIMYNYNRELIQIRINHPYEIVAFLNHYLCITFKISEQYYSATQNN